MLKSLLELFWSLFPPCLVRQYRTAIGLHEGDPRFVEITDPYWTKGHGTSCAVVLTWALQQCRWPGALNRGNGFVPGRHMQPILEYAEKNGMVLRDLPISQLKQGDIIYLEGDKPDGTPNPDDWHVGVVERLDLPRSVITLDGGQKDKQGREMINRVERPIVGDKLGPTPRRLKMVIRPKGK